MYELIFKGFVTVKSFEDSLFKNSRSFRCKKLCLNLRNVDYIEITVFVYMLSLIARRVIENKETVIKLPASYEVRNIFRIWRFPIVIKEITNLPFRHFVHEDDLHYFGENRKLKGDYYKHIGYNEFGLRRLLERGFFSLTCLPFDSSNLKMRTISNEPNYWDNEFIKKVLEKHLKKFDKIDSRIIPRVIIYECLTNAYRHPDADLLLRGSFLDFKAKLFTIFYWDNGNSMIQTLKKPLSQNLKIKADFDIEKFADKLFSNFQLKYYFDNNTPEYNLYFSDYEPSLESKDYEILLSCFFPGISRDPEGMYHFMPNKNIEANSPGMGLTYLLLAAVDKIGGSVAVRTDNFFLNIEQLNPCNLIVKKSDLRFSKTYSSKIKHYSENYQSFHGNMITIRLPLK